MTDQNRLNLAEFRKRIGAGKEYWRSLDELSRDDFDQVVESEFPQGALALERGVDRRDFVKLMGASMALGGLAACNRPDEKIVPYVRQPEGLIPGKPIFFATVMPISGYAHGVLVESHMGRPTKIEGNPDHPSSLGATNAFMQASVLGLYDPDRSQVVRHLGEISTWSDFLAALQPSLKAAGTNGAGLRLLTQTVTSPTLGAQIQQVLAQFPGARWHQWEAAGGHNVREGMRIAFGGYANAVYHFDKANVVVALDADFLERGPGHLRYARDFSSRRKVRKGTTSINRLYAIESGPDRHRRDRRSPTGCEAFSGRGVRARHRGWRRYRSARRFDGTRRLDRRARPRPSAQPWHQHRRRRRRAAARPCTPLPWPSTRPSATSARRSRSPTRSKLLRSIKPTRFVSSSPT